MPPGPAAQQLSAQQQRALLQPASPASRTRASTAKRGWRCDSRAVSMHCFVQALQFSLGSKRSIKFLANACIQTRFFAALPPASTTPYFPFPLHCIQVVFAARPELSRGYASTHPRLTGELCVSGTLRLTPSLWFPYGFPASFLQLVREPLSIIPSARASP